MNNELYTLDPLFDFKAICDTDLGLFKLIKEDYYDRSVFDTDLFDCEDNRFVKTMLLTRTQLNPLFIFCNKGVLKDDEIDNLYKQFLDEEYDRILELSTPTSIMNIATISNSVNKIVNVTVLCENEKEKAWINKYDYKLNCIVSEYDNFDLTKYDTIYIKDIHLLTRFNQESITKKNIIIPRFLFNLESEYTKIEMPKIEVVQNYYQDNKFMVADPYKGIKIPVG